jgi:hypothetical protein
LSTLEVRLDLSAIADKEGRYTAYTIEIRDTRVDCDIKVVVVSSTALGKVDRMPTLYIVVAVRCVWKCVVLFAFVQGAV